MSERPEYRGSIPYSGSREQAHARLLGILRSLPRVSIEEDGPERVRVVFTSRIFRFKDDVDLHFPEGEKLIHFRSSSRVGYWDFGANRRRMERLRALFEGPGKDVQYDVQ